jgi:hypothetical protein
MGIDGIGKPGGANVPPQVGSARTESAEGFTVGAASEAAAASKAGPSDALDRLQRGELALEEYLDMQVEAATAHLRSLPPDQLDFVRETLRAELREDPVLVELVRRATGAGAADLNR